VSIETGHCYEACERHRERTPWPCEECPDRTYHFSGCASRQGMTPGQFPCDCGRPKARKGEEKA